ncbi:acyl-CoA dehydrogenase family protein [Paenibacillus sacheonensis]|uniref:Acyl-CoA dehydrogenase n=1 Tax=Paenibacillus sacheonensis TaxID=742054 RepID=A0A7X4YLC4_9BACL|nr:acyl-CoA dehydrogenase family protein [Paenibacillus sacheonensis]MBM7568318.1 alkylation response protein AidB-like acyl-CoA dehydrogenase [Paenibacillus sacheonensis]NBC68497.1 acyl-CoA dehydrogenase [Paenibacillus sacheonensis]
MRFRFSQEQEALRERVRTFARAEVAPAVIGMEENDAFPRELVKKMGREGLLGLPIAAEWGGSGCDMVSYMLAIEEISRVSAAAGVILAVHTSVGTLPIVYHGTSGQQSRCLPRLASGAWLGAFALTEPHAGSDASAIRTIALRREGGYALSGTKVFITNAGEADQYVLFAVVQDDAAQTKTGSSSTGGSAGGGITAFLVSKDTPGFTVGRKEKKMGLRGSNTCELILENVQVPASQRLGAEGQGFRIAKSALSGGRIGIGAQALGIARAALALAERELPQVPRRQRARADAELLDLAAATEAAALLVYRAAELLQRGRPCTKEASMAKMFASDTAVRVATRALQWCGPEGLTEEHAAERYFRDAKVTQIYEGTNEIHRIVISGELLKG